MPVDYSVAARIAYLKWAASIDDEEAANVQRWRDYVDGDHPVYLTERQREFLGLSGGTEYAHNLCALVIDVVVERLNVSGFSADASEGDAPGIVSDAWRWWELNRMDAVQDDVYHAACRDAVSYIIVDWSADEGRPTWTLNYAWDSTQGVMLHHDTSTDEVLFASKRWTVNNPYAPEMNGRTRMTLYFEDRVEKYITALGANQGVGGTQWEPYTDAEGESWPLSWVDAQGKPLGIAVIPFENPGGSEIKQALPLQDMLNKADIDMIAATDMAGFRVLWGAGIVKPRDPVTGEEIEIEVSPGEMVTLTDPSARLGAIDPVDIGMLITSPTYWIQSMAGVTRTPQYLFQAQGAQPHSGESLKQQEVGLVHKVERKQKVWGNSWEDVIYLSAKLAGSTTEARIQTLWHPPQAPMAPLERQRDEAEARKADVDSGLALETALERQGWSREQIEMALDKIEEQKQRDQSSLGQMMARAMREFDQGEGVEVDDA